MSLNTNTLFIDATDIIIIVAILVVVISVVVVAVAVVVVVVAGNSDADTAIKNNVFTPITLRLILIFQLVLFLLY